MQRQMLSKLLSNNSTLLRNKSKKSNGIIEMKHPYKPIYYESVFSMLVERDENLEVNI